MANTFDRDAVVRLIQSGQGEDSLRTYAKRLGVSPAYLSDVFRGRRDPGPTLLRPLGFTTHRIVTTVYRRRSSSPTRDAKP